MDEITGSAEQGFNRSVEMDAPEHLDADANFFDYPPFAQAVSIVSAHSVINENDLKRSIYRGAKKPELITPKGIPALVDFVRSGKQGKYPVQDATRDIRELLGLLSNFPDWADYVRFNCSRERYKADGSFRERTSKFVPPKSYPAWLSERITREQRLKEAGIRMVVAEAFPQQMSGATVAEAMHQTGVPNPSKKWRMLKSSGIVPQS